MRVHESLIHYGLGQITTLQQAEAAMVRRNIPSVTPTAVTYASAPGCHVIDLSKNACMADDGTQVGCNLIQECGPLTGQGRCQFQEPGMVPDPSLPFCTGSGPTISYTPSPTLRNPTGPSTIFRPTTLSTNAVPVGSSVTAKQAQAIVGGNQTIAVPAVPTGGGGPASSLNSSALAPASNGTVVPNTGGTDGSTTTGFDLTTFLTASPLGVPNWAIGLGIAAVAAYFMMKK